MYLLVIIVWREVVGFRVSGNVAMLKLGTISIGGPLTTVLYAFCIYTSLAAVTTASEVPREKQNSLKQLASIPRNAITVNSYWRIREVHSLRVSSFQTMMVYWDAHMLEVLRGSPIYLANSTNLHIWRLKFTHKWYLANEKHTAHAIFSALTVISLQICVLLIGFPDYTFEHACFGRTGDIELRMMCCWPLFSPVSRFYHACSGR